MCEELKVGDIRYTVDQGTIRQLEIKSLPGIYVGYYEAYWDNTKTTFSYTKDSMLTKAEAKEEACAFIRGELEDLEWEINDWKGLLEKAEVL